MSQFPYPWMKSIRALRSLRPLRMVHRIPMMKISINATASAIPASLRVMSIQMVFVSVFAILGVQLFSGGFSHCSDSCISYRYECVSDPQNWHSNLEYFDLGSARDESVRNDWGVPLSPVWTFFDPEIEPNGVYSLYVRQY